MMIKKYNNNYVDKIKIDTDKYLLDKTNNIYIRTFLEIPLLNVQEGKEIGIIMMNPSYADKTASDKTVNLVIDFFVNYNKKKNKKEQKIKKITILNLFPICSSDPREAYEYLRILHSKNQLNRVMKNNLLKLKNKMVDFEYIVLAWGLPPEGTIPYLWLHQKSLQVIRYSEKNNVNMYVFKVNDTSTLLRKTGDPRHPAGMRGENQYLSRLVQVTRNNLYGISGQQLH
ncbi:DUF1643 domain-containing protein [Bacillus sp. 1P06AnD]|uniref:DUF1643 domain-containing protein n=1 Tax=Bacillus sp. 1P06AnD TaxID=3132208 RepID=UPI0039A3C160